MDLGQRFKRARRKLGEYNAPPEPDVEIISARRVRYVRKG